METDEIYQENNSESDTRERVIRLLNEIKSIEDRIAETEIIIEPVDKDLNTSEIPIEKPEENIKPGEEFSSKEKKKPNIFSERQIETNNKKFLYNIKKIKIGKPKHKHKENEEEIEKKRQSSKLKKSLDVRTTFTLRLDETGDLVGFSIRKPEEERWFNHLIKKSEGKPSESDRGVGK